MRKPPSWPRSWAYTHRNARANSHLLGQPNALLADSTRPSAAGLQKLHAERHNDLHRLHQERDNRLGSKVAEAQARARAHPFPSDMV